MISSYNINGMQFSTKDSNNDQKSLPLACSIHHYGAWWYNACTESNLNGLYLNGVVDGRGVYWTTFLNYRISLKFAQMKIRFRNQHNNQWL